MLTHLIHLWHCIKQCISIRTCLRHSPFWNQYKSKNQNKFIWPFKDEKRPNPRTTTPDKKPLFSLVTLMIVAGEMICFVVWKQGAISGAQLGWKLRKKGPVKQFINVYYDAMRLRPFWNHVMASWYNVSCGVTCGIVSSRTDWYSEGS